MVAKDLKGVQGRVYLKAPMKDFNDETKQSLKKDMAEHRRANSSGIGLRLCFKMLFYN